MNTGGIFLNNTLTMVKRKDSVQVVDVPGIGQVEFRIPWRGIGHWHGAAPMIVEPICKWNGLLEDCPRTRRERREAELV